MLSAATRRNSFITAAATVAGAYRRTMSLRAFAPRVAASSGCVDTRRIKTCRCETDGSAHLCPLRSESDSGLSVERVVFRAVNVHTPAFGFSSVDFRL